MNFCNNCGCSNPDSGLFCWKCGSKLAGEGTPSGFTDADPAPFEAVQEPEAPGSAEPFMEETISLREPPAEPAFEVHAADDPVEMVPAEPIVEDRLMEHAPSQPRTIDLGSPRSIDLGTGPADAVGGPEPRKKPKALFVLKKKEADASTPMPAGKARSGSFLSDPFNARIVVMMCGILTIIIASYCLFGFKPAFDVGNRQITAYSLLLLAGSGVNGVLPSDAMSVCIVITLVLAVIGAIRVIPVLPSLAGIVTAGLYYSTDTFRLMYNANGTMTTDSILILVILWIVVAMLSMVQFNAMKSYTETCGDEPYPLVRIWFGRF